MNWLLLIAAIILLRILFRVVFVIIRDPWIPKGLSQKVKDSIGDRLSSLGFHEAPQKPEDNDDVRNTATYQNDRFQLEFFWDRQQLFAELAPLDLSIIPVDKTLPPLNEQGASSPPYSAWDMLRYVGVEFDVDPFALRSPRLLNGLLRQLHDVLSQLRPFLSGDFQIYMPYRRLLQIRQLRYDWEGRGSYSDTEAHERKTLANCRSYAKAWWDDGDFESSAKALEIIEDRLTDDELDWLAEARRRSAQGDQPI